MDRLTRVLPQILLVGLVFAAVGCDSNDDNDPEIGGVNIEPDDITLGVGESADFSVEVLDVSGEVIQDADAEIRWWSTDEDVFIVNDDGLATGETVGEAMCMVEITSLRFTGRDSAFVSVVQF